LAQSFNNQKKNSQQMMLTYVHQARMLSSYVTDVSRQQRLEDNGKRERFTIGTVVVQEREN